MSDSWAHRFSASRTGSGPSFVSKLSANECARSVDSTTVRWPISAHRTAVAADTVVFPTPPLPVYSMTRIRSMSLMGCLSIYGNRRDDGGAGVTSRLRSGPSGGGVAHKRGTVLDVARAHSLVALPRPLLTRTGACELVVAVPRGAD